MGYIKEYFILLFLCLVIQGKTQLVGLDLMQDKSSSYIDFSLQENYILIDVKLDGKLPLTFIFDTGAEHTILFERTYTDLLEIPYDSKVKVVGSNLTQSVSALICRNVALEVDQLPLITRDILVLEENYLEVQQTAGVHLHGILGASFFQNTVLEIDYKNRRIYFHHPNYFEVPKSYESFDLDIINNKPYLDCDVVVSGDTSKTAKLLLDTGAALVFLLHANSALDFEIPDHVIEGNLGIGVSGFVKGYVGKSEHLEFGKYSFENILTNFQDLDSVIINSTKSVRDGIIGNTLLSRFQVIINYQKGKLYLKPKKNYNKAFDYDKSGLSLLAFGRDLDKFLVSDVVRDSPAAKVGILPGDIIVSYGLVPRKFKNLSRMLRKLSKKEGKTVRLKLRRGEQKYKVKFELKDLLK